MTMRRSVTTLLRLLSYVLALMVAPAAIVLLSQLAFTDQVAPDFVLTIPNSELPANLFNDLSSDMLTITAGLAVSTIVMFRLPTSSGRPWVRILFLAGGMMSALLASYSGLRFRYELAQVVRLTSKELDPVLWRLHVQGLLLAAQVSFLCVISMYYHFHRKG